MAESDIEGGTVSPRRGVVRAQEEGLVLAELVSRVLDRGVVVAGDVTISVAGIDLVYLGLRLHLTAVESAEARSRAASRSVEPI
jgi:hypothetical protein